MSAVSDELQQARERIASAYAPDRFASMAAVVMDQIAQYLKRAQAGEGAVLNWALPQDNIREASNTLQANVEESASAELESETVEQQSQRIAQLVGQFFERGQTLHNPRYIGHQVSPPVPLSALFDSISSISNQGMAIYEMGPWATAIEQVMINTLGQQLGLKAGTFSGLVTSGGSLANLTALLTARNHVCGDVWEQGFSGMANSPVIIAHAETHYCVSRAAGILGIGTQNLLSAAVDQHQKMDATQLDRQLGELRTAGRPVIAVVASACSTRTGAFDPLADIAQVCQRHKVWMHVDAAHGAAVAMSERHRHLIDGIDQADSIVWDAHKMLFMPALSTYLFYKNPEHQSLTFQQEASYLFDPNNADLSHFDTGQSTVECTKRAATFALWGTWASYGPQLFRDMVDVTIDLAQGLYQMLADAPDFEPINNPECNIIVFRYMPHSISDAPANQIGELQAQIRRRIVESGAFYIVSASVDGMPALRTVIMNPLTTREHLAKLLEAIREHGRDILAAE
jgi:L-2,4-diaminobutyrate decarboxylase